MDRLRALVRPPAFAQHGATNGEWRYKDLKIIWEWNAQNFGKRPDFNWEVTPLMANGVLYFTAGTRRDAVAVDAATGETLWI